MGRDKATIEVDGVPMARRVADALLGGGCTTVVCVGGDPAALGLPVVADEHPGEGPLGGILTALHEAARRKVDTLVVAACDLPDLTPASIQAVLAAIPSTPTPAPDRNVGDERALDAPIAHISLEGSSELVPEGGGFGSGGDGRAVGASIPHISDAAGGGVVVPEGGGFGSGGDGRAVGASITHISDGAGGGVVVPEGGGFGSGGGGRAVGASIPHISEGVGGGVATLVDGGGRSVLVVACRTATTAALAEAAWGDGVRSVRGFLARAGAAEVTGLEDAALRDVDHPRDLRGR